jgi:ATP-dependent RNA helicase UAP56/SUB2
VEKLLKLTNSDKQVIMVSATMDDFTVKTCSAFMKKPQIVSLEENELVLAGLAQFFIKVGESCKFERLCHLLDTLAFNQVIVFVNRVERARKLTQMLGQKLFNPICIHSRLKQEERIKNYDLFKANGSRLLVATDLFGRGIDIERVNLVINYGTWQMM